MSLIEIKMQRLSTRLTPFYKKVIVPFYILMIVAVIIVPVFILPAKYNDLSLGMVPSVILLASLAIYLISRMKVVYFNDECLIYFEGKKEIKVGLNQISSVKAIYPFLYRISLADDGKEKSILFTPRIGEIVFAFKVKSNSINNLKKAIMKSSSSATV